MFFINSHPVHVSVRSEDAQYGARGQKVKTLKRRVFAKFQRGIPAWAVPFAEESLDFSHMPPERTVEQWCGFYDSEADQLNNGWTDEERAEIEAELLARGYLLVEKAKAGLPYPAYAKHRKVHGKRTVEHAISDILATLAQTGDSPGAVIAYENDHPDEHSASIIAAVQAPLDTEPEEQLVAA